MTKKTQKEYLETFYLKHPEKKEKIICSECGQPYAYTCKSKHNKTKIHKILSEKLKQNLF